MWYLGVLKYAKLCTEREIYLRRNILIDEYFVQDDSFSAETMCEIVACKTVSTDFTYNTRQRIFNNYMCNVFDKLISDSLG